jgi:hypothetical protein
MAEVEQAVGVFFRSSTKPFSQIMLTHLSTMHLTQARRLQRALEREQRQVRHATMRGEFHDEIAQPDPDQEGEEQEGEEVEEADAGEDAD